MHPQDRIKSGPRVSKNGKYIFRLQFNGCFRKVTIDDRLPASSTTRSLHVIDRNNPHLVWPALVEKAYLKVRGGYDFPGSNSGTDLWVLTGWIPEQVFLLKFVAPPCPRTPDPVADNNITVTRYNHSNFGLGSSTRLDTEMSLLPWALVD